MIITNEEFKKIVPEDFYYKTIFQDEKTMLFQIKTFENEFPFSDTVEYSFEQIKRVGAKSMSSCLFIRLLPSRRKKLEEVLIKPLVVDFIKTKNIISALNAMERIEKLDHVFKIFGNRCSYHNIDFDEISWYLSNNVDSKIDLISENFLVCPNENFLSKLKQLPKPGPIMCGRAHREPKVEITTFNPYWSFIWNQKPFDLTGFKMDEKSEKGYKLDCIKPRIKKDWKPKSIYDIVWDEFTKEITEKEIKGDKNNMDTNKNKTMRPDSIMIDEENKVVVAFLNNKKIKVVCDKDDKFDFRIGLGVVVSKINDANKELQYLRQNMNWKQYYLYCYKKFFYFDANRIKAFENSVFAEQQQYKLKLDEEKVRKFRCEEVELSVYKPKKISHSFILFNPGE